MRDFHALQKSIERHLGIKCDNYKQDYINRRVLSRMRLTGKNEYKDYHSFLLSNPDEQDALRNALTINVTKFWRDKEVFDILHRQIMPDLMGRKRRIRIWSAGCSTGEESYTIAMVASDLMKIKKSIPVSIYATDIDHEALKKAKEGIYEKKSLENLSSSQIRRHFTPLSDDRYEVKSHLREIVRFVQHDLMSGIAAVNYLDIILCRNVTIYFTERQKNELARMFHAALNKGGFYVMGKTEFLGREVESLFIPYNSLQKIFQKHEPFDPDQRTYPFRK